MSVFMSNEESFNATLRLMRRLMVAADINQSELARRLGVTRAAVSAWFCRAVRPDDHVLRKIGRVLDIDPRLLYPVPTRRR